ncbi:DUF5337 domain-containing protein [Celeribacter litoreus]|uniref:DUF5337 domain-containing protein n=1 Tax=Celeribacter litoreus TaxID=2876714 RepID=UPI001CCDE3F3|nr:DUF5337 domain-containing protein [Celeribacter litoreus]MCA0045263.1 DUF5337 domain-containing protein [Celeribacter litoreus]
MGPEKDQQLARKARMVAVVIAATMLIWIGVQWIGGTLGLDPRYVFLFDLAALASFVWAMVVIYQIWRDKRQQD